VSGTSHSEIQALIEVSARLDRDPLLVQAGSGNTSLRLAMHAVVPRATIHVHSVNTIAWALREDEPAHMADRLAGLRWQWIPYVGWGLPLARAVEKIFSNPPETERAF
jgi:rhamnose utilization protein RhaD (predicted bifunctional aldolase and dehydrogenase)